MKWLNRVSSLFLICFSVLIFSSSLKLGIGEPGNPGPGFMSLLASILLFCLSLFVLITHIIRSAKDQEKKPFIGWGNLKKPISLVIALFVNVFLFEFFGYVISTFLLTFIMLVFYEPKKWHIYIVTAAIVANLSFLIFYRILGVELPAGIFRIRW